MRRVLIITYYWPPSGGSAVLRWLKFSKYLRDFGWEPVIFTPENPEPQEIDESLLQDIPENMEILKTRIIEPYSIYKWLTGKKQSDRLGVALMNDSPKKNFLSTLSLWIRSNFFIPDPRMLWIRPSVRNLLNYLKENPVDLVISTGPPHSMHLIARKLKKKTGVKWVADFRDPWTNIDFYKELLLSKWADQRHRKLEQKVLTEADQIITVSPGMTKEFLSYGAKNVITITNGFDRIPAKSISQPAEFSILHLGSMPRSRNPENLWKVLSELVAKNSSFASSLKIDLIGKTDIAVRASISSYHLDPYVRSESFIPNEQAVQRLTQSAVLLLCINNTANSEGILTNKFFEYLSANRSILAIGPVNGDASFILQETGAGKIFDYNDFDGLKNQVISLFELYSQNKLVPENSGIEKYSRKVLTGTLSNVLNNLIS